MVKVLSLGVSLGFGLGVCASVNIAMANEQPEIVAPASAPPSSSDQETQTVPSGIDSVGFPAEAVLAGEVDDQTVESSASSTPGALTKRVLLERETAFNPYVLTAHKHNFFLPISYTSSVYESVYQENDSILGDGLRSTEVKFQISLKTRLNKNNLFFANDELSVGVTVKSWWQQYSEDISRPFRETNYQPEIFYLVPLLWGPLGGKTAVVLGLEHESNGKVQGLSRSWNRIYTQLIYEKNNLVMRIRPWYRIPEEERENPGDAKGDDNPDILEFMGHGEFTATWRTTNYEYSALVRRNTATGKGAVQLGMTFPLFAKFRGFVQYFNGYGESLIEYDHFQQRIGMGVALTNIY